MDLPATQAIDEEEFGPSQQFDDDENSKAVLVGTLYIENKSYSIVSGITLIGRNPVCKIVINHETVSKKHAEIEAASSDGAIFIRDLKSCNKTKINNTKLRPNTSYQIKNGDILSFGKVEAIFKSHTIEDSFVLCTPQVNNPTKLVIPGTPDSSMNNSSTSENDVSTIPGTQTDEIEKCFRPPYAPIKSSTSNEQSSPKNLTVSVNDLQSSLLKDESRKSDFSEAETQRFSDATKEDMGNSMSSAQKTNLNENKSDDLNEDIYDMETQRPYDLYEDKIDGENVHTHHSNNTTSTSDMERSNIVSVDNIETDKHSDSIGNIEIEPFNDSTLRSPVRTKTNENSVYSTEPQEFVTDEAIMNSIENLETQAFNEDSPVSTRKSNDLSIYSAQTQKLAFEASKIELDNLKTKKFDYNNSSLLKGNSHDVSIYSAETQKNLNESSNVEDIVNLETQKFIMRKSDSGKRNSCNVSIYSAETQKNLHESSNVEDIANLETQHFIIGKSDSEKRNSCNVSIYSAETQKNLHESSRVEDIANLETQHFIIGKSDSEKRNSCNVSIYSAETQKNLHESSRVEDTANLETQQFITGKSDSEKRNSCNVSIYSAETQKNLERQQSDLLEGKLHNVSIYSAQTQKNVHELSSAEPNQRKSICRSIHTAATEKNESITCLQEKNLSNVTSEILVEELSNASVCSAKIQTEISEICIDKSLENVVMHKFSTPNSLNKKSNISLHNSESPNIEDTTNKSLKDDESQSFVLEINSKIDDEETVESQSFKDKHLEILQTSTSNEEIKKSLQNLNDPKIKNFPLNSSCNTAKLDSNSENTDILEKSALKNYEHHTITEDNAFPCSLVSKEFAPSINVSDTKSEQNIIEDEEEEEEEMFCSQNLIENCPFAYLPDSQIENQSISPLEKTQENEMIQNQNCTDVISNISATVSNNDQRLSKETSVIKNQVAVIADSDSETDEEGIFANHLSKETANNKWKAREDSVNISNKNDIDDSETDEEGIFSNNLSKEDDELTNEENSKKSNNENMECYTETDDEGIFSNHLSREEDNKSNNKDTIKNIIEKNIQNDSEVDEALLTNFLVNESENKMSNKDTSQSSNVLEEDDVILTSKDDVFNSSYNKKRNSEQGMKGITNTSRCSLSTSKIDKNTPADIEDKESSIINLNKETGEFSFVQTAKTDVCNFDTANITPIGIKNESESAITSKKKSPKSSNEIKEKSSIIKDLENEIVPSETNDVVDTPVEEQKLTSLKRHSMGTEFIENKKFKTGDDSCENTDLDSTIERNLDKMFDGAEQENLKENNSSMLTQQLENILEDSQFDNSVTDLNTSSQSPTLGTKRYSSKIKNRRSSTLHIKCDISNREKMSVTNLNDTLEINLNQLFNNSVNTVESYASESTMTHQLESVLESQESSEAENKEISTEKESFNIPSIIEKKKTRLSLSVNLNKSAASKCFTTKRKSESNLQSNFNFDTEKITSQESKLNISNSQNTAAYSANVKSKEKCKTIEESQLEEDTIDHQLSSDCDREIVYKRGTAGFSADKEPVSTENRVAFLKHKNRSFTSDSQSDNEEDSNSNLRIPYETSGKKRINLSLNKNVVLNSSQSSASDQEIEKKISTEQNDRNLLVRLKHLDNATLGSPKTEPNDTTSLPVKRVHAPGTLGFIDNGPNKEPVESEELVSSASTENEDEESAEASVTKVSTDSWKQEINTTATKTEMPGLTIVRSKRYACSDANDSQNVPPKRMKTDEGERHKLQELSVLISPLRENLISNRYDKRNEIHNLKSNFKQSADTVEPASDSKRLVKTPKALNNFVLQDNLRSKTELSDLSTIENSTLEDKSEKPTNRRLGTRNKGAASMKKKIDSATVQNNDNLKKEDILVVDSDLESITTKSRTRGRKAERKQMTELSSSVKDSSKDEISNSSIENERSKKTRTQSTRLKQQKKETKVQVSHETKREASVVQDSDLEDSQELEISTTKRIRSTRVKNIKSSDTEKEKSNITANKESRSRQAKTVKSLDSDQLKKSEVTVRKSTRNRKIKELEDFETESIGEPEIPVIKVTRNRRGKVPIQSSELMVSENDRDKKESTLLDNKTKSSRPKRERRKAATTNVNIIESNSDKEISEKLKENLSDSSDNGNLNTAVNKTKTSRPVRQSRKRVATNASKNSASPSEESQETENILSDVPIKDTEKRTRRVRTRVAKGNDVDSSEECKNTESSRSISDDVFEIPASRPKRARLNKSNKNEATSQSKAVSDTDLETESLPQKSSTSRRKKTVTSASPSISRNRRSTCMSPMKGSSYKILFTGDKSEVHRKIVTKLGGFEVQDPSDCSILVADKVRRTFKFLCSLARGIPIVSVKWLDDSNKSHRFLDWEDYILNDSDAEDKYKFNLKESLEKAKNKKLLEDYTVVLTPNIKEPPISELKEMVVLSGGKPLVRPPSKWPQKTVIVSKQEDLLNAKKFIAKAPKSVSLYSTEFILTGILRQNQNLVEFKLSV